MAKFVVLGAKSFYGRNFIELLKARGDEVVAYRHYYGRFAPCDYIVNFASKSLVAESWDKPKDWVRVNVGALTNMVRKATRRGRFGKFVHVSTPESYGSTPHWVDETYKDWKPSTPYAVTRAAADMMLMAYYKACGFPAIITRTANIYGNGQQDYRVIPKALACKLGGHTLQLHGSGTSVRSFIHVKDACEATRLVCLAGRPGETYHISTNQSHSIGEVVEMIGCSWEPAPERLGKDHAYLLNSDKLRSMGWKDTISLEEGLKECASAH